MATITARTTIAAGATSSDIDTSGIANIAFFCSSGQVSVEVFLDSSADDGWLMTCEPGDPKVIAMAGKLVVRGMATSSDYEVISV